MSKKLASGADTIVIDLKVGSGALVENLEEARELGRKGGIASGKARLRNKHGKELVRALLSMQEADPQIREELRALGIDPDEMTNEVSMHIKQMQKAQKQGDTVAYNSVYKAAGYEEQKINVVGDIDMTFKFGE